MAASTQFDNNELSTFVKLKFFTVLAWCIKEIETFKFFIALAVCFIEPGIIYENNTTVDAFQYSRHKKHNYLQLFTALKNMALPTITMWTHKKPQLYSSWHRNFGRKPMPGGGPRTARPTRVITVTRVRTEGRITTWRLRWRPGSSPAGYPWQFPSRPRSASTRHLPMRPGTHRPNLRVQSQQGIQ